MKRNATEYQTASYHLARLTNYVQYEIHNPSTQTSTREGHVVANAKSQKFKEGSPFTHHASSINPMTNFLTSMDLSDWNAIISCKTTRKPLKMI